MVDDKSKASDVCGEMMGYISEVSGGVFPYDSRIFGYDFEPIEDVTNYFLNYAK